MEWISVKDRLPEEEGWYLVWAPRWRPGRNKEIVNVAIAFSKFRPNYKFPWSLESRWDAGVVEYWSPFPADPGKAPEVPNYSMYPDDYAAVKQFTDETGIKIVWTSEIEKFLKWLFTKKKKVDNPS